MIKDLMFKLGWVHKSDVELIAKESIAEAIVLGKTLGRNEVYSQQYKAALEEQRLEFERRLH